jgi:hypothetical protein
MGDYSKKTVLLSQNTNVAQNVVKIKSSEDKFFVANHSQMQPNRRFIAQYGNTGYVYPWYQAIVYKRYFFFNLSYCTNRRSIQQFSSEL